MASRGSPSELRIYDLLSRRYSGKAGLSSTALDSRFRSEVLGSRYFYERLGVKQVLDGHHGCVNALAWNEDGSMFVSGSDDRRLCIWQYPVTNSQPEEVEDEDEDEDEDEEDEATTP
ncbi:hypothetical protein EV182_008189, partial [Spiromyces aspiralis]